MSAEHLEVEYINPEKENNHINPLDVRSVRDFQYHLTEKRNDPLVSITAAKFVGPLSFGYFSLCLWTAPNLLSLLKTACDYSKALSSPIKLHFKMTLKGDAEIYITQHEPYNNETLITKLGLNLFISTIVEIINKACNYTVISHIWLPYWPYTESEKKWVENETHCNIHIGSPIRKIIIERKYLYTELKDRDSDIYETSLNALRQQVATLESTDIRLQVYNYLDKQHSLGNVNGTDVASHLGISFRTLNRRLIDSETSYRSILQEYRLEKALYLLNNERINMAEIAFRLGFSDLSAFSRAFKKWTGECPSKLNINNYHSKI
ncbi:helix-turn-helix transcriptional regulator [Vibrio parahaemolyticus]|nr:helix-turn-helix transcriptional regulator [Vibrio parahaemolyticus]